MTADAVVKSAMDYDMCNIERKGNRQELHPFIQSFRYCIAHSIRATNAGPEHTPQRKEN